MRRGNKVTLYELMQPGQASGEKHAPQRGESSTRVLRLPVGFLYIGSLVVLVLLIGVYALGYQRGGASVRAEWELDRVDSARVDQSLRAIAEVDEPGGGTKQPSQQASAPVSALPTKLDAPSQQRAADPVGQTPKDPRQAGWNYYVIAHPSEPKVDELVDFCRKHGLVAHVVRTSKGAPKVFVVPGFEPGGSGSPEMIGLRQQIREVGILWERLAPSQHEDFSARFPEKYQPPSSGS